MGTGKDLAGTNSKVLLCLPQEEVNCRTNDNIEVRERVTSIEGKKNKKKDNRNNSMTASDNFNLVEPSNKSPKKRNSSSKGLLSEILQKIITNSKNNTHST